MDTTTKFEWQRHTQEHVEVPPLKVLLEFLDLRAQASESSLSETGKRSHLGRGRTIASFQATMSDSCVVCKAKPHPLYACAKFRSLTHDQMITILRKNELCFNCLRPGHFIRECLSTHRCQRCQKQHHTLLHVETKSKDRNDPPPPVAPPPAVSNDAERVASHVANRGEGSSQVLLMTCQILVTTPQGTAAQARALLDSASSSSFVSERLAQHLRLKRSTHFAEIAGIGGLMHHPRTHAAVQFGVSSLWDPSCIDGVRALVLPKVTTELPLHPVSRGDDWRHLSGIRLADPEFGTPGRIDVLLGADVFGKVLLHGRRSGICGSPIAIETTFGWVLTGAVGMGSPAQVVSHHVSVLCGDELLRKFWEVEDVSSCGRSLTKEERAVVQHFEGNYRRDEQGRFVVPLPLKPDRKPLGESRSTAVRRFVSMERSLHSRNCFKELDEVIGGEYFTLHHAEPVPECDLAKPREEVYYLPIHAVVKSSSSTTKTRAVFDASAPSSSWTLLNDMLMVGPTVHSTLVDVLLRFRMHRVALTTDVSKMYRAVLLPDNQRDLHRFVWRSTPDQVLRDYRMTRLTFGVSSSSFAANMCIKQNSTDFERSYPLAAKAVSNSFYVDDGLTGEDSVEGALALQKQLQELFVKGGFLLRKWRSSEPSVLQHLDSNLLDEQPYQVIPYESAGFSKALGVEWNANTDCFRISITEASMEITTKRALASEIAKTYDILGWFAPSVVLAKVLLQRLWECGVAWDEPVPPSTLEVWTKWRNELPLISEKHLARCYFPKESRIVSKQLHGFSDASEAAYAGVVYLRMIDSDSVVHISLVMAKTRVAPIKRLTIPRLELCGANLLSEVVDHTRKVFNIALDDTFAWTDSTIVLHWLSGNPRLLKTFVGNRISNIMELIPPGRWRHVGSTDNPADPASRGLYPSELLQCHLWWNGPDWLRKPESAWPVMSVVMTVPTPHEEHKEVCLLSSVDLIPDPPFSYKSLPLLRRWNLCQRLTRHFWERWSTEYLSSLRKFTKWHFPTRNLQVGDLVCLCEDNLVPTKWPLGRVVDTHPGDDGLVRVVIVRTSKGTYKRPVVKIALILPTDS